MLAFLARLFLLRRLLGSRHRGRHAYGRQGYGRHGYGRHRYGRHRYGGRPRGPGFGMLGPFPTYSRRTRGGGRVSVGGCCLPIPLTFVLAVGGVARLLAHRR